MKYLSLFSGIGGFETALLNVFPDSECIGYSEIKAHAKKVYESHYPNHTNLGDITKITNQQIATLVAEKGCDIIFGGFPCKNLSSLSNISGGNSGLCGSQSGLLYEMMRIIKNVNSTLNKKVHVIFENNGSMSNKNKTHITDVIKEEYPDIHITTLNGSEFGVQHRNRLFWTDFPINKQNIKCIQTWDDVLDPVGINPAISENYLNCLNKKIRTKTNNYTHIEVVKNLDYTYSFITDTYKTAGTRTRWQMSFHSDTGGTGPGGTNLPYTYPIGKSRPITGSFGNHNVLIDRRGLGNNQFAVRMFSFSEIEKLFGFEEGYTQVLANSKSKRKDVLGNSVIIPVIEYIFSELAI